MVSQFLVLNNRVQQEAAQTNRAIYGRVQREIFLLMGALLLLVGVTAPRQPLSPACVASVRATALSLAFLRLQAAAPR